MIKKSIYLRVIITPTILLVNYLKVKSNVRKQNDFNTTTFINLRQIRLPLSNQILTEVQ